MRMRLLLLIITAITIVSCNDARKSETFRVLEDVDSYIEARPDSALAVLEGIDVEDLGSREKKAKYALLMSMALDKNYIDRTDFEVLQPAIDYYEDQGSATDKLRTFYYQGRIYQNGGDDEMAMECFVRAVEEGDGAEDCTGDYCTEVAAHAPEDCLEGKSLGFSVKRRESCGSPEL